MASSFCKRNYHYRKRVCIIFLFLLPFFSLQAQRSININAPNTVRGNEPVNMDGFGNEVMNVRYFDYNPVLKNLTPQNISDTLLLDFFEDRQLKAVIKHVAESINGDILVRATVLDESYATCIMVISEEGISISVQLPMRNEAFFAVKKQGRHTLSQCNLFQLHSSEPENVEPVYNTESSESPLNYDAPTTRDLNTPVTIDLLIVYTQAAAQWAATNFTSINHVINSAIEMANEVMENSQTHITFNVVHQYQTNYVEVNNSDDLTWLHNSGNNEVRGYKRQYRADAVILIAEISFTGGVAYPLSNPNGSPDDVFSLIRVQQTASSYTLVHEVGHNMGCHHHKQQNFQAGPGLFSYSAGWRSTAPATTPTENRFSTVMTYEGGNYFADGIYCPRIPYFSSPLNNYRGEAIGDAATGDNARTLRQTKDIVADYSERLYNASLSAINISTGSLFPNFHPDTTFYTVILPPATPSINITPVTQYSDAQVFAGNGIKPLHDGENEVIIKVRSGDRVVEKFYTLNIIVSGNPSMNDSTLLSLSISQGVLEPAFSPTITHYSTTVPYTVREMTVTARPANLNATVNGVAGLMTRTYSLTVGDNNIISIVVVSANGNRQQTYTITVNRLENDDAALDTITLSTGTLSPAFTPATYHYHVTVPFNVEQITVNGIPRDLRATVSGNREYPLAVGNTVISLQVTAANGISTSNYQITVNRIGNNNANLQEITLTRGTLIPEFSPDTTQYEVHLTGSLHQLTISSVASDTNAVIQGNGTYTITTGEHRISLTVTAQDSVTTKQYTINFISTLGSDATLASLTMSEGVLSPAFSPATFAYQAELPPETERIQVTAIPNDSNATVIGGGFHNIDADYIIVSIMVLAENTTERNVYEIVIDRGSSIHEVRDKSLLVYPNPTSGELYVRYEMLDMRYEMSEIQILDVFGRNISNLKPHVSNPITIDISHLPAGMYFLRIGSEIVKVIKQ